MQVYATLFLPNGILCKMSGKRNKQYFWLNDGHKKLKGPKKGNTLSNPYESFETLKLALLKDVLLVHALQNR